MTEEYIYDDVVRPSCIALMRRVARSILSAVNREKVVPYLYFKSAPASSGGDRFEYEKVNSWDAFYRFARTRSFPVYRWQRDRYLNDESVYFVAIADESHIYSHGWVTRADRSYMENHDIPGMPILFDFETPVAYRGKGYYTRLLRALRNDIGGLIYARPDNLPSVSAIRKAGFVQYA